MYAFSNRVLHYVICQHLSLWRSSFSNSNTIMFTEHIFLIMWCSFPHAQILLSLPVELGIYSVKVSLWYEAYLTCDASHSLILGWCTQPYIPLLLLFCVSVLRVGLILLMFRLAHIWGGIPNDYYIYKTDVLPQDSQRFLNSHISNKQLLSLKKDLV